MPWSAGTFVVAQMSLNVNVKIALQLQVMLDLGDDPNSFNIFMISLIVMMNTSTAPVQLWLMVEADEIKKIVNHLMYVYLSLKIPLFESRTIDLRVKLPKENFSNGIYSSTTR